MRAASSTTSTASRCRDAVGLDHILFETDYPHTDGTLPDSRRRALGAVRRPPGMDADECYKLLRGNAIHVLRPRPLRHHRVTASPMRPEHWTEAGESACMARLVALQVVAGQQLETITAAHGIAFADYLVLGVVRRSPDGACTPSTICEVLGRTSGGMTLTLDRLEGAGWIAREPDPHDRRRVLVRLTAAGHELAVAVNESLHEWERALLGRHQLRTTIGALDELLGLLEPQELTSTAP